MTLTGAGGSGKTRLALEATAGVVDEFPEGVVLVELAPLDSDLVSSAIVAALGVSQLPGRELVEVLVGYLRGRRALIVLDNFEHVRAAARCSPSSWRARPT